MPRCRASTRLTLPSRIARARAECEGRDGRRRRSADAGQRRDRRDIARERTAVVVDDRLRGGMQMVRAAVVAEPRPMLEHAVDRCGSKRADIRKARDEALVVRQHGSDLRLLQHHLGQPDAVRIARVLPGQAMAAVLVLPGDEPRSECRRLGRSHALLSVTNLRDASHDPGVIPAKVTIRKDRHPRAGGDPVTFTRHRRAPQRRWVPAFAGTTIGKLRMSTMSVSHSMGSASGEPLSRLRCRLGRSHALPAFAGTTIGKLRMSTMSVSHSMGSASGEPLSRLRCRLGRSHALLSVTNMHDASHDPGVIPAKVTIRKDRHPRAGGDPVTFIRHRRAPQRRWVPAFAGTTIGKLRMSTMSVSHSKG